MWQVTAWSIFMIYCFVSVGVHLSCVLESKQTDRASCSFFQEVWPGGVFQLHTYEPPWEGQCQGTGEESPSISLTFNLKEKCSFHPGHVTLDPLFILSRVFEGLWEFTHSVFVCFVDLTTYLGVSYGGCFGSMEYLAHRCRLNVRARSALPAIRQMHSVGRAEECVCGSVFQDLISSFWW